MSGVFKVKLTLGKGFPQEPPKAFFLTKIFHPNVAPNGEICVNTLKKDWKSDLGIKHILLVSAARPSARSNYQPLPCRPSNAS
jgi:ubiquitin-protein ligase